MNTVNETVYGEILPYSNTILLSILLHLRQQFQPKNRMLIDSRYFPQLIQNNTCHFESSYVRLTLGQLENR